MSTNVRPSKRARVAVGEEGSRGGDIDDLSLTFSSALGLGGTAADENDEEEVPDLLIKTLTFLAESTELVRSRAVCRVFRRWSDSIAKEETANLIGPSVQSMVGQSVTALLHGAEKAGEETKEMLKGWNAEASRAEGFDVGIPTYAGTHDLRGNALALISVGDLAPGIRVPVGLKFGVNINEDRNGVMVRGTTAYLPPGFFHVNAYPIGLLPICSRLELIRQERNLHDTLRRVQHDLSNPDWGCPHSRFAYRFSTVGQDRTLYSEYFVNCCQIFSGYKLGLPIPPQFEVFCAEVAAKSQQIEDEQNAAQEG